MTSSRRRLPRARRMVNRLLGPPNFEEVEIARRVLPKIGYMVDVGAHRGTSHADFVETGWTVLAVEPDPENRRWMEESPHPRVTIVPRAITAVDDQTLTLYTSRISTGISTLSPFHDSHVAGVEVQTARLDSLIAAHGSPTVDFLKVDTEGFDLRVLETYSWSQPPAAVVCEFEDRKTIPLGYSYRELGQFLVDRGYVVLMSEWYPIVEYGQNHRWRRVVRFPAEVAEPDAWGNFIAVRPEFAKRTLRLSRFAGRRLKLRGRMDRLRNRF